MFAARFATAFILVVVCTNNVIGVRKTKLYTWMGFFLPVIILFCFFSDESSCRVNWASATETVDSDSIPGRVKQKTTKIDIHSFLALRSAIYGNSVKLPPCVINRWASGSLTRWPNSFFTVSFLAMETYWWMKCNSKYCYWDIASRAFVGPFEFAGLFVTVFYVHCFVSKTTWD